MNMTYKTPRIPCLRRIFIILIFSALSFSAQAQTSTTVWSTLWGTDKGLYSRNNAGRVESLWAGGKVDQIIQSGEQWIILTDRGIFASQNLRDWEGRNQGLPQRIIKTYGNGAKALVSEIQEIKDLSVHPDYPEIMVCAFSNAVYLTRNSGRSWENLRMPNYRANGIKAAAVFTLPGGELTVFCSHSIYGVYYIYPGRSGAVWTEVSAGLEKLETTDNPDEVSDFAIVSGGAGSNTVPVIYASQTFRRRIYRLDWEQKRWNLLWSDGSNSGAVDSLAPGTSTLKFLRDGEIMEIGSLVHGGTGNRVSSSGSGNAVMRQDLSGIIRAIPGNEKPNCAVLRTPGEQEVVSLSELWLLDMSLPLRGSDAHIPLVNNSRAAVAENKEGLYLPVNHAADSTSLRPYLNLIEERRLNMIVIDMKDDYGRLRFTPQNASLTNLGRVFRPVDIEVFLRTMKERGIYTVARIVVFKDPEAAAKNGGAYAVWDSRNDKPWQGYYDTRRRKPAPGETQEANPLVTILRDNDPDYEIVRTFYDEKWVDPYSEIIWDYNAAVAEELYRRGFDEIQFDYIRFPTDGVNLGDARYRWRDNGMDMDSAILSFLRHVRSRVNAPISVDIYGANGWYRTGSRTGQEVEMLAPWVDIICPMYYPSHFEQYFLAQDPPERRPYRIYYHGTLRTHIIARGRVVTRPWAQAFYLNVSYDRRYYNDDYVRLQAEAVRAVGKGGLTYWNNSGRYEDVPK